MEIRTPDDVLELLDASVASAAAGVALELGLFWLLSRQPMPPAEVGDRLGIPAGRAQAWLQVLERAGLLDSSKAGFAPSAAASSAILATYSWETWALLAEEARERRSALLDLPRRLREPGPVDSGPGYVSVMTADPDRARRFTRMLFEIHQPLAALVAESLDLADAGRLLDIGGGSGVVSMALARRNPTLRLSVIDIANVCAAGRELADEQDLGHRVSYLPGDFLRDPLPRGFDVALECDVGVYNDDLFRRVLAALRPGGRFLIVDQLAPDDDAAPAHLEWALERSLDDPGFAAPTVAGVTALLEAAGFEAVASRLLPTAAGGSGQSSVADDLRGGRGDRFGDQMTLIEARAPLVTDG